MPKAVLQRKKKEMVVERTAGMGGDRSLAFHQPELPDFSPFLGLQCVGSIRQARSIIMNSCFG